jgi:hypothetical protein
MRFDMETIDSRNNWKIIDELLESETNDWRRQMLSQLKEHVQAECGGDLEALMATLVDDPNFHNWTASEDSGPKGYDNLREFYSNLIGSGSNQFEYRIERIVIGDDTLVTEGEIKVPFRGSMLQAMGITSAKPGAFYATRGRTVTFWPFSKDGRIMGEDIYSMTTDFTDAEEVNLNPYTYGEDE